MDKPAFARYLTWMDKEAYGYVSLALGALVFIIYWISIYRGKTRPHLYSHMVWTILATIGAAVQIIEGGGPGAWSNVLLAWGSLVTTIWALFKGERHRDWGDYLSLAGALAALPIWILTENATYAVIIISVVSAFGFYPTIHKSWSKPRQESLPAHSLNIMKVAVSLLALETFSFTTAFYPGSFLVMNVAFVIMVMARRHWTRR